MFKRRESKLQSDKSRQAARKSKRQRRLTLQGLEQRQLMAASFNLPTYSGPRNVGSVQAFVLSENETTGTMGVNDTFASAQFIPLGNTAGRQNTIDLSGSLPFTTSNTNAPAFQQDLDVFRLDLNAGDILDISGQGSIGTVSLAYGPKLDPTTGTSLPLNSSYAVGTRWLTTTTPQGVFYPIDSPLQTTGNVTIAQVVPETRSYYLTVAAGNTSSGYTIGLRTYRPVTESLPVAQRQKLFLDFDGAQIQASSFGTAAFGLIEVPSIMDSLTILGIQDGDTAAADALIDRVINEVNYHFSTIATNGNNGDFDSTGVPGQYGVEILNSRDDPDPGNDPLVTRLLIGGDSLSTIGQLTNGIAQTIDVGNFRLDDVVYIGVEGVYFEAQTVPRSPSESLLTATAVRLSSTVSHEAAHVLGLRHTDNTNTVPTIIDAGGTQNVVNQRLGIGPDGIFGTLDDVRIDFRDDRFDLGEGISGVNRVANALAWVLSTGQVGGGTVGAASVSGRVFNDLNRNKVDDSEGGFGGITVFADVNGNGVKDAAELSTVTAANGSYSLNVGGSFNIIAVVPNGFLATTPTTASAAPGTVNFGMVRVQSDVTGFVFGDNNSNGVQDTNDRPLSGIYVYLDLDGDDRPDLGEPSAVSAADGSYSINFPGPGTYTIREVLKPGLVQTFPVGGEHIVTFDGTVLNDNYNFGNLPSRDYGDAPDTYSTTRAAGGPSHGIISGLTLGTAIDREIDGQPSTDALGDDDNGALTVGGALIDDEDGIVLNSPLGPGSTADLLVTAVNSTGTAAYLQGWMDFNNNGVFEASEQVITNRQLGSGTSTISVNVPSTAQVGNIYARFRYSQTQNLGPGGDADSGEVEDYRFTVLAAAEIVNDDTFSVPRNETITYDVLANDFDPNSTLAINNLNITSTLGTVRIASDQRSIIYTPPTGFIGQDSFQYSVRNEFGVVVGDNGLPVMGNVTVNVTFQSSVPIAIDDTFVVPQGSTNRALNVLDNDIPSLSGGLTIASITPGNQGGSIRIIGGGQSLSYSPLPGFNGTEQFTYSVIDGSGNSSTAQVTVVLSPGPDPSDDQVAFSFETLDPLNNTPISSIQAGQDFKLRVYVDDVRNISLDLQGVASAFLDVLYTDELVTTVDSDPSDSVPFDITYGQLFTAGNNSYQQSDSIAPGLLDDVGALQANVSNPVKFSDRRELFTVTMRATAPGVAVFQADPADNVTSDTVVVDSDVRLTPSQLRLGRTELIINPASTNYTSAIDDAYTIANNTGTTTTILDVQTNDLIRRQELSLNPLVLGAPLDIIEFGILQVPSLGNAVINSGENVIRYTPNTGANGLDTFTYYIVTEDGTRSTAEVNVTVGNAGADDLVGIDFAITDANGNVVTTPSINVGDRFGVQITVDDLRGGFSATEVFAAFADILYDRNLISVADTSSTDRYDFDVVFGNNFDANSGVGSAARPGIIDEFGTQDTRNSIPPGTPLQDPRILATLFFTATAAGTTTIKASPADSSPSQDTLLLYRDDPVPKSQIFYDSVTITIGGAEGEFPLHNTNFAQDVNGDGTVSAIDALTIINAMNRQYLATLEGEAAATQSYSSSMFLDVNGDKHVSAVDALMVINYMNTSSLLAAAESASGEQIVSDVVRKPTTDSLSSSSAAAVNDSAIATLTDSDSKLVSAGDQSALSAQGSAAEVATANSDADDEDDVLSLLADDVASVWS